MFYTRVTMWSVLFLYSTGVKGAHDDVHDQPFRDTSTVATKSWDQIEETSEFWRTLGRSQIKRAQAKKQIESKAKNVILFIGDGMGIPTMTAGRILINGESHETNMDSLHYAGLVKTYNVDFQTPDSAGTATAYLTGVKGREGTLGVNAATVRHDCSTVAGNEVESVLEKAYKSGMSVGIVTTTYVTHASPAGSYAKTDNRGWYSDGAYMDYYEGEKPANHTSCKDIATQLFEKSGNMTVIMGGGRRHFYPNEHEQGRKDGNDFIANWKSQKDVKYVDNKDDLFAYANAGYSEDRLIGIFAEGHLEYHVDREEKAPTQPSLINMTEIAIRKLSMNPNGFYLFVEGGKIDHGHHDTEPIRALYDFKDLDESIGKARELVNLDETLVMVSADHSHVFTIGGYGRRGANLFGVGTASTTDDDENTFIIGYANGPGFQMETKEDGLGNTTCGRPLPSESEDEWSEPEKNTGLLYPTSVKRDSETHGAEDVAVTAQGPWAHLVTGINEQIHVAHVAEMALCLGDYISEEHCVSGAFSINNNLNGSQVILFLVIMLMKIF